MRTLPAELCELTAAELIAGYRRRSFSPVEVVQSCLQRIDILNPLIGAFVEVDREAALKEAAVCEARMTSGNWAPLLGVPIAIKDIVDTAGLRTAYGSDIFRSHIPMTDAACVTAVRRAGAILIGKTATHEFAWGFTTDNPHFGVARNPWDHSRTTGGSSGGSASAVACGMTPIAIGSDTGGSIRLPASYCGIVGLKPTHGGVDVSGVYPLAPSLDHVGPLSRTAEDAYTLWNVLAGLNDRAPMLPHSDWRGTRIGVGLNFRQEAPDEAVASVFQEMLGNVADSGGQLVDIGVDHLPDAADIFVPIQLAEALHVHTSAGLLPRHEERYGADVRARINFARRVTLEQYLTAEQQRRDLVRCMQKLLRSVDVVVSLCSSSVAPRIEEIREAPDLRRRVLGYTAMQNLTGLPSCAIRIGFERHGMPVGMQITGRTGDEGRILALAHEIQSWHSEMQRRQPEIREWS